MKKDIYLKVILTIIAICLVWICVRDVEISPTKLYANEGGGKLVPLIPQEVIIVGIDFSTPYTTSMDPIPVIQTKLIH